MSRLPIGGRPIWEVEVHIYVFAFVQCCVVEPSDKRTVYFSVPVELEVNMEKMSAVY